MISFESKESELRIRLVARKTLPYFTLRDMMAWLGCTQYIPRPRLLVSEFQTFHATSTDQMRKHLGWLDRVEQFLTPSEQKCLYQLINE